MSDIAKLQTEIENLKQQLFQNSNGVKGLLAQLDAHKQQMNEAISNSLIVRTNFILVQKHAEELAIQLDSSKKEVVYLKSELDAIRNVGSLKTQSVESEVSQPDAA